MPDRIFSISNGPPPIVRSASGNVAGGHIKHQMEKSGKWLATMKTRIAMVVFVPEAQEA